MPVNTFGQPVGHALADWEPPPLPPSEPLRGRTTELEPLDVVRHAGPLFTAFADSPDETWTYTPYGPFRSEADVTSTLESMCAEPDWLPYAIVVDDVPSGFATYLRIKPHDGVVEVGGIAFSPSLQRTLAATESLYLLIKNVFDLGYRRCEWKCDHLNTASRGAADRLGFRYEGTFLQATHYKGRNRDTAWYAITDTEWHRLDAAFRAWLSADNFGAAGHQLRPLRSFRR